MLLNREKYPSWLYPVTQGATTIWERWDGQKPDGTFQSVGMNSFNHYAYGAIGEWMYGHVAGINIDPEKPGYKHILFSPHPGGELNHADAEFLSMYGPVKSAWKFDGGDFVYEITVPANTTASVTLPAAKVSQVATMDVLKPKLVQNGKNVTVQLGSGDYSFRYPASALK